VLVISFVAHGIPAPKGSAKAFVRGRRAIVVNDCERTKPWQAVVMHAAIEAMGGARLMATGPMTVGLEFRLPRPKALLKRDGTPRDERKTPAVKPDLDKLVRAILDAITEAGAWVDDGQVVSVYATKVYSSAPGVTVSVGRVTNG
jgi:Holliday junction resolvase RusA-like endonuclease